MRNASVSAVKARVLIRPKEGILDPQGKAVERALPALGFEGVSQVRIGRLVELEADDGAELEQLCEKLLANPLIEDYEIEVLPASEPQPATSSEPQPATSSASPAGVPGGTRDEVWRMRFGVLQFPGSCDERDAVLACERVGDARLVWHGDTDLDDLDAVVVPGGFSYGDYLRAGAIARFAPAMEAVREFAASGGPVLGICNGFQVLCEAGLLPGALLPNEGLRFICRQVEVEVVGTSTVATGACAPGRPAFDPGQAHERALVRSAGVARRARGERPDRVPLRARRQPKRFRRRRRRGRQRGGKRGRPDAPPRARGRAAHRIGGRPGAVRVAGAQRRRRTGVSPVGRRRAEPTPAPFVVGVGRSGTTLLRLMLDAHPRLAIPAETHFVPDLITSAEAGSAADDLVARMVEARAWNELGVDAATLRQRVAALARPGAAAVLRTFYGLCAEVRGKARWGDKTPIYVAHMRTIGGTLPEARFVHLIRDGRDVALSRRRRGMGEGKPLADTARLWRRRIENARQQARRLRGRYLELRYEDLIADAEPELRRVCELIELDYDPAMLGYHRDAGERLAELGDLPAEGGRRARAGDERQAAHALAAEPPTSRSQRRLARADERLRPGRVRGGRRRAAGRARLRRAILLSRRWRSTTRSDCCATAASGAARRRPRRRPSWSASAARARRCCG